MRKKVFTHRVVTLLLICSLCLTMCACTSKSNDTLSQTSEVVQTHDNVSSEINGLNTDTFSEYILMYTVSAADLKINPDDAAAVSSFLPKGSPVLAKDIGNGWCEINMDNILYFVRSENLTTSYVAQDLVMENGYTSSVNSVVSHISDSIPTPESSVANENTETESGVYSNSNANGKIVVIDAGHQQQANLDTEPIGPGSSEMKIKVSGGTSGAASGLAEYELTLALALKLQPILEARGYTVVQTRTTNDIDISNIERANVANSINASAFIRIHANGSDNPNTSGAMTLCQTPTNPYNGNLYEQSKALSTFVLDELVSSTGCTKEYVWETDTMAGINWAQVPVTIVEVGYMSNPQEDLLMASDDYQNKICVGIANGIDKFFTES